MLNMAPSPSHRVEKPSPRQQPVSCVLCRTKKLKCDRQVPCSNCVTRRAQCQPASQSARGPQPSAFSPRFGNDEEIQSILVRLGRLEEKVGLEVLHASSAELVGDMQATVPDNGTPEVEDITEYRRLGNTATQEPTTLPDLVDDLNFFISPSNVPFQGQQLQSPGCIWLPNKVEADMLFELYLVHVEHLQHILYVPTVRSSLNHVYARLEENLPVDHHHVSLLLSIFAAITFYWTPSEGTVSQTMTTRDSAKISAYWIKAALDVIDRCCRIQPSSLEIVQARTILFFLMYNSEGFTSRVRIAGFTTICVAKDIGLHRIDATDTVPHAGLGVDVRIEAEVKRRVWWYLASSDWAMTAIPGPQEGTYFIQPKHMRVLKPRNIYDEDLSHRDLTFARPMSQPTTMSYFLQRIRFSEICRHIGDVMPLGTLDRSCTYADILNLDTELQSFFAELPEFLRLDDQSRRRTKHVDELYPQVAIHRYVLGLIVPARRCALHQAFLIRGLEHPYTASRAACIDSAWTVIRNKHALEKEKLPTAPSLVRQFGATHHMFLAIVVLAMDFCYNRLPDEDEQRRRDLVEACKMLETSEESSWNAQRLLDAILDVLRRHGHDLGDEVRTPRAAATDADSPVPLFTREDPREEPRQTPTSFGNIWTQYIAPGSSYEMPDWDVLASGLQ